MKKSSVSFHLKSCDHSVRDARDPRRCPSTCVRRALGKKRGGLGKKCILRQKAKFAGQIFLIHVEGIVHSVQPIRMAALKQWWPAGEHGIIISNFVVVNTCKGVGYTDDIRAKNFFDTTDPAPTQGKRLRLSLLIGNTEPFGPDRKRWREVGWRKQSAVECTATAAPSGQAWAERLAQAPLEIAAQLVDWEGWDGVGRRAGVKS